MPSIPGGAINDTVVLGVASLLIRPPNAKRSSITIVNAGTVPVYVNFADVANLNTGVYLVAGGGNMTDDGEDVWRGAISGISGGAAQRITFIEKFSMRPRERD